MNSRTTPRVVRTYLAQLKAALSGVPDDVSRDIVAGGFVIPIVGWVVGLVMLWASPIWSDREKWSGSLAGLVAAATDVILAVGIILLLQVTVPSGVGMPVWSTVLLVAVVVPFIANVRIGIRLLRSAQSRRS
jgi:hypothetical protein